MVRESIVVQLLFGNEDYYYWSCQVRTYLLANDLWDVVESAVEPPKEDEAGDEFKIWRKKNASALHAIQISCSVYTFPAIGGIDSAKIAWDTLADIYGRNLSEYMKPGDPGDQSEQGTF